MAKKVLITGGAGFIGSHIADRLVNQGYEVMIYDNLNPQIHDGKPAYLNENFQFIQADIRDRKTLKKALQGVDIVSHQAATVGVGQSMYKIEHYTDVNIKGTATLLDIIVNENIDIEKLVVASSMSIYGEGEYYCPACGEAKHPILRSRQQLRRKGWEFRCEICNSFLEPKATSESKPLNSTSVYAISKRVQEEMCLMVGRTYDIPTVALRYFNVYGPRQSLNNPYTGVCAIFSSRIKNGNSPLIFEDGNQTRDFIHVHDIALANQLVIETPKADMEVFNVGSGSPRSIKEVAELLIHLYQNKTLIPKVVEKYREGDIRHCYADISKIKQIGFEPQIKFEEGMKQLVEWGKRQESKDKFETAKFELEEKGLLKGEKETLAKD